MSDIPFHRLWQPADSGQLRFVGLRLVGQQNLLLVSNGNETKDGLFNGVYFNGVYSQLGMQEQLAGPFRSPVPTWRG